MFERSVDNLLSHLGYEAVAHRKELQELKNRIGITHSHFDCWLYAFLESKQFCVPETIASIERREAMEKKELCMYDNVKSDIHDYLACGVLQIIGTDRLGRICIYVRTARHAPCAKLLKGDVRVLDVVMTYATRLRDENKSCRVTLLINQKRASVLQSVGLFFQRVITSRLRKFYPGLVERVFVVNMSKIMSLVAQPLYDVVLKDLSGSIVVVSDSELRQKFLLQWFDQSVLPVELGGELDTNEPSRWQHFADDVTAYFNQLQEGTLQENLTVKEWELQQLKLRAARHLPRQKDVQGAAHRRSTGSKNRKNGNLHELDVLAEGEVHALRAYSAIRDEIMRKELMKRSLVINSMMRDQTGDQAAQCFKVKHVELKRRLLKWKYFVSCVKLIITGTTVILLTLSFLLLWVILLWWDNVTKDDSVTLLIAILTGSFTALRLPLTES